MARKFWKNAWIPNPQYPIPKMQYLYKQEPHDTVDKELEGETLILGSN
jgi:hypothetical protein